MVALTVIPEVDVNFPILNGIPAVYLIKFLDSQEIIISFMYNALYRGLSVFDI